MKNKKIIAGLLLCITITMMFFTYQIVVTYDSSHYLWLTSLLTREGNFSDWDIARGPIFPIFIRICNILFGQSSMGIIVGMFAFYIAMLVCCYFIYKDTIKDEECLSNKMKWILGILFFFLVVINPMIIGYFHTLLTEFIGITLAVIGCYLSWKWMEVNFLENKSKYIIYTIILAILTSIAWLLKQPYITTILFPVVIASIISIIRNVNIKNILQKVIMILTCVIVLVLSLNIWNVILELNNVNKKEDRSSAGYFSTGLLKGITEYKIEDLEHFDTIEEIEENEKIDRQDKEKIKQIIEDKSEYKSYIILDNNKENYEILYSKGKVISTLEATKFLLQTAVKEPATIIQSYFSNYLATISVYNIDFNVMEIIIEKKLNFTDTKEISIIGFKNYGYGNDNIFPLSEEYEGYAAPYRNINKPIVAINWIMRKLELPTTIAMKISYLALPLLVIASIVMVFRTKKKYNKKYCRIIDIITILYTYSFLHILVHALLGSTIDRYTIPALATTFIAILLSIYAIVYRKKYLEK